MTSQIHSAAERRAQPRLPGPFPVRVRGVNAAGRAFETHTLADDISQGGLYLQAIIDAKRRQHAANA